MANEKLSYEIAALYTGQPAIKSAFDDFAKLNAAGAKVTRELDTLAKQSQKTGEALRNSRQGTAQLGMQFNQLGTQIAGGTSPLLAFQQQLGDIGYAMSFMGGTLGKVGNFLAGPWGAAIIVATTVLSPFISKLWDVVAGADAASNALANMAKKRADAMAQQNRFVDAFKELEKKENERRQLKSDLAGKNLYVINSENALLWKKKARLAEVNEEINQATQDIDYEINSTYKLTKATEGLGEAQKKVQRQISSSSGTRRSAVDEAEKEAKKKERELQQQMDKFKAMSKQMQEMFTIEMSPSPEIGRAVNALKDFNEQIKEIESLPGGSEFLVQFGYQIDAVRDKLVEATQATEYMMGLIPEQSPVILEALKRQQEAYDAIGSSVDDAFKKMLTAGGSWRDGMRGIIQSVIDQLWKMYVTQKIVGFITSSIGGAFGGNAPTNLLEGTPYMGARAMGGSVMSDKPYLVGEKGPELFVPGSSGAVIPNNKTMGLSSGSNIVVNVDARGSSDPAAVRAQVQQGIMEAAPAIIAAAESRTMSTLRRPRLGGAMQ